jgi:hypothetical protein
MSFRAGMAKRICRHSNHLAGTLLLLLFICVVVYGAVHTTCNLTWWFSHFMLYVRQNWVTAVCTTRQLRTTKKLYLGVVRSAVHTTIHLPYVRQ